jgi:DNA-binding CsgD family transcriptional regulator
VNRLAARLMDTLAHYLSDLGLTGAEIDTALRIFEGSSLRDIARARSVHITTARTQLGQAFAKLDVGNQVGLVRALAPAQGRGLLFPAGVELCLHCHANTGPLASS